MNSRTVRNVVRKNFINNVKSRSIKHLKRCAAGLAVLVGFSPCVAQQLTAQTLNQEKATALISQLDNDDLSSRNLAERELVKLGTPLIEWLDLEDQRLPVSSEVAFRLKRIRSLVFENSVSAWCQPSTITATGNETPEQWLTQVLKQSGNQVSIIDREDSKLTVRVPGETSGSFWNVVGALCRENRLAVDHAASRDHMIALVAASEARPPLVFNRGPLRIEIPGPEESGFRQVQMRIMWEPRFRLLAIRIPMSSVSLTNRLGQPWGSFNPEAVYTIPPPATRSSTVVRLPVRKRDRSTVPLQEIAFSAELKVIAPDARCVFQNFRRRDVVGQSRQYGMASVSVDAVESGRGETRVRFVTRYDRTEMAEPLHSHTDWSRYCEARIVTNDGQIILPVNKRQIRQEPYAYTIEYTFKTPDADNNSGSDLKFRIPSGIISATQPITMGLGEDQER